MGTYFWKWATFVSYSNRQVVFNNKIGHENFCPGSFKRMFYGTKVVVAVTKICFYMFYMLFYINFTREKKTHSFIIWLRAWNLRWIFATPFGIKFCITCSSSVEIFRLYFCRTLIHPLLSVRALFEFTYLTNHFSFIMLTEIFQFVEFCASVIWCLEAWTLTPKAWA
jgi:hypothetical protein